jgi:hypothetical protein
MLTLDRVLDELSQQTTDVANVPADVDVVESFSELTWPAITRQTIWFEFEPTVSVPMPWIRAQLW